MEKKSGLAACNVPSVGSAEREHCCENFPFLCAAVLKNFEKKQSGVLEEMAAYKAHTHPIFISFVLSLMFLCIAFVFSFVSFVCVCVCVCVG